MINFAVVTISDSCFQNKRCDGSGPILRNCILSSSDRFNVAQYKIISDDFEMIKSTLISWCEKNDGGNSIDIIVTSGGTGFSDRDVTPEATKAVIEKEANGLSMAILINSLKITKFAALSRAICGIRNKTLIVNFPGSEKAVQECWLVLEPLVTHIYALLNENCDSVKEKHDNLAQGARNMAVKSCICQHSVQEDGSPRSSKYPMIKIDQVGKIIDRFIGKLNRKKTLNLQFCCGYILAEENILAPYAQPSFDASVKDGYAVLASDGSGRRRILGCIPASYYQTQNPTLVSGTCYKINTGAPIPTGADAVVQIEDTELCSIKDEVETEVIIKKAPIVGQDIRPKGSDVAENQSLIQDGCLLGSSEIAILASIGREKVVVYEKPKIAVFSTGDELVYDFRSTWDKLPIGAIFDSNLPMLKALFEEHGFLVEKCGILRDERKSIIEALTEALDQNDVIVTTGGVSMGEKDLMKDVLVQDLHCDIRFGRLFMKPGKPTTFATCDWKGKNRYIFALPGNPVSAWVTSHLLVIPALKRLSAFEKPDFSRIKVQLVNDRWNLDFRPEYVRATLILGDQNSISNDQFCIKAYISEENQTSSRLLSNKNANLLIEMPEKTEGKSYVVKNEILNALLIARF